MFLAVPPRAYLRLPVSDPSCQELALVREKGQDMSFGMVWTSLAYLFSYFPMTPEKAQLFLDFHPFKIEVIKKPRLLSPVSDPTNCSSERV
jgi:hypothetical protein